VRGENGAMRVASEELLVAPKGEPFTRAAGTARGNVRGRPRVAARARPRAGVGAGGRAVVQSAESILIGAVRRYLDYITSVTRARA
jgi:hypothetical protein